MNELAASLVLGLDDANRIVNLVTGAPVGGAPEAVWWRIALIAVGLAAGACVAGVAVWRLRTSAFDASARAFSALARRRGLGAEARELVRRAAGAAGCEPVALLVSRHALVAALERLGEAGSASGDGAPVARVRRSGAS